MISVFKKTDIITKPSEPLLGDVIIDYTGTVQVFTEDGWIIATHMDSVEMMLAYRQMLEIYADPDNWIGNEFWADGGGDPKRFAREALGKKV